MANIPSIHSIGWNGSVEGLRMNARQQLFENRSRFTSYIMIIIKFFAFVLFGKWNQFYWFIASKPILLPIVAHQTIYNVRGVLVVVALQISLFFWFFFFWKRNRTAIISTNHCGRSLYALINPKKQRSEKCKSRLWEMWTKHNHRPSTID